uniref:ARAD1D19800p n=1 Tax=Blastobotrys adeninivorans TaxID=409370 RepID=A0A060TF33_BLAAD
MSNSSSVNEIKVDSNAKPTLFSPSYHLDQEYSIKSNSMSTGSEQISPRHPPAEGDSSEQLTEQLSELSVSQPQSDPPAHLSEFYSLVKPGHSRQTSTSSVFRRPSMASTLNTSVSQIGPQVKAAHENLPAVITSRDIEQAVSSYSRALEAAQAYSQAIRQVANAAAQFGSALDDCASCKGAGISGEGLTAAGGLHYLVSNHEQILANSIEKCFQEPVQKQLEVLKSTAAKNEAQFKHQLRTKSKELQKLEKASHKLAQRKLRNLSEYRSSLLEITARVDDIDRLKYDYFESAYSLAQNTSTKVLEHACSAVRAQLDICEAIARKGWSGGGLDDLIAHCPDPFAKDASDDEEDEALISSESEDSFLSDHDNSLFDVNDHRPKRSPLFTVLQPGRSILPSSQENTMPRSESTSTVRRDDYEEHNDHEHNNGQQIGQPESEPMPEPELETNPPPDVLHEYNGSATDSQSIDTVQA